MRLLAFAALVALALPACAHAGTLAPLSANEIPALLKPPAHGVRILAVWALDCAYCEANMQVLAKLQQAHPRDVELVTIATDSIAQQVQIAARLKAMRMDGYPAHAYAEASPEHLDFLIDQDWGGETPRTEIIHADGSRQGISGALAEAQLRKLP
ncbi:thioredoxin domain-containing protein [Dyella agri]|uniref:Thioredoxin domain-containing protein n=1 Tax=Dyella agri TaxID=1926869 RepID=A0ABW8KF36_9GAMM